jgi:hypothetical protein
MRPAAPRATASTLTLALIAMAALCTPAAAATLYAYYGDDDGFGVGKTGALDTIDPVNSHSASDAALTDVRLIGTNCGGTPCVAPAFAPVDSFTAFSLGGEIMVSAQLTMRVGAFDSGPNPFDGPNVLKLDGMAVDASFLSGFSSLDTNKVQTRTIVLSSAFFALLSDGSVSLRGTHISNDTNSGSFQVDMLRLTMVTEPPPPPPPSVPAPGSAALALSAMAMLAGASAISRRGRAIALAQVRRRG